MSTKSTIASLEEESGWANEPQDDEEKMTPPDSDVVERAKRQNQILLESGLIGCIKDGPGDLSTNYKKYIAEYLDKKYPQHKPKDD